MHKYSIHLAGSAALLSLLVAVPAFAQTFRADVRVAPGERPEPRQILQRVIEQRQEHRDEMRDEMMEWQEVERPEGRVISIGGKVTAISSPNFSLEVPANRERATTTITVATTDSTEFKLNREDGSFADVSVGSYAMALGIYASSTQTLTARKVDVATSAPPRGLIVREEVHDRIELRLGEGFFARMFASTTPSGNVRGFFIRTDVDTSVSDEESNFVRSIFQRFQRFFGR